MTQEEKYLKILSAIADALEEKDRQIELKDWKIADLEERLRKAVESEKRKD